MIIDFNNCKKTKNLTLDQQIERLCKEKDQMVKEAEYERAVDIRNRIEVLREQRDSDLHDSAMIATHEYITNAQLCKVQVQVNLTEIGSVDRPATTEDIQQQLSAVSNDPNMTFTTGHLFPYSTDELARGC